MRRKADLAGLLGAYARTRWRPAPTREAIQVRQLVALLAHPVLGPKLEAAPNLDVALARLPLETAAEWRAGLFAERNVLGLSLAEARLLAEAEAGGAPAAYPGFSFGLSTGTSGPPGVFITDVAERGRFLGTMLGKTLPPGAIAGARIALLLRHANRLYDDVGSTGCVRFRHFGLATTAEALAADLAAFDPTVVVGPPSALLSIAAAPAFVRRPLRPGHLFTGAEPLFPGDRERLRASYGVLPRQIYQATEGFVAVECPAGGLHINEDVLTCEWQRFEGAGGRAAPVITDFSRTSQHVARLRLDDIVRLDAEPCRCGSPLMRIAAVEGRFTDVLYAASGKLVFPFDLEAGLSPLLDRFGEWQVIQNADGSLTVACAVDPLSEAVFRAVRACLSEGGGWTRIDPAVLPRRVLSEKRRRFVRLVDPESAKLGEMLLPPSR